ncbi:hypothetical protein, partial [Legionella wadsworthii]
MFSFNNKKAFLGLSKLVSITTLLIKSFLVLPISLFNRQSMEKSAANLKIKKTIIALCASILALSLLACDRDGNFILNKRHHNPKPTPRPRPTPTPAPTPTPTPTPIPTPTPTPTPT